MTIMSVGTHTIGTFLAAMLLAASASVSPAGETIRVAGSTTVKPILDEAASRYRKDHPDVEIIIGAGGSERGIERVGNGEVQIGMSSKAIKPEDKQRYPDLNCVTIGHDGIALIVHAANPVRRVTSQQVRDVFTGRIANWRQLGGDDSPIVLVSTNENHGTFQVFCEHFGLEGSKVGRGPLVFKAKGAPTHVSPTVRLVDGTKPVLAELLTRQNGISYVSLGAVLRLHEEGTPLQVLELDGVQPTLVTVRGGTYTLQRPLVLMTNGLPRGPVKDFLDYVVGPEGQALVQALGFIPVR